MLRQRILERLIPFYMELGYVSFDNETIRNRINANSQVVSYNIPEYKRICKCLEDKASINIIKYINE